jgi:hypothetical protein
MMGLVGENQGVDEGSTQEIQEIQEDNYVVVVKMRMHETGNQGWVEILIE